MVTVFPEGYQRFKRKDNIIWQFQKSKNGVFEEETWKMVDGVRLNRHDCSDFRLYIFGS